jgi:hypothetical protein
MKSSPDMILKDPIELLMLLILSGVIDKPDFITHLKPLFHAWKVLFTASMIVLNRGNIFSKSLLAGTQAGYLEMGVSDNPKFSTPC